MCLLLDLVEKNENNDLLSLSTKLYKNNKEKVVRFRFELMLKECGWLKSMQNSINYYQQHPFKSLSVIITYPQPRTPTHRKTSYVQRTTDLKQLMVTL